jgi:antitoxin (DNA-binding transcriptional repressor) of toxin-antitoxin stability system
MKQVTASEARKNWFRLLDEALDGEVIAVQRKGHRLVLRREDVAKSRNTKAARQYKRLLQVPDDDKADQWSWDWRASEHGLVLRRRSKR